LTIFKNMSLFAKMIMGGITVVVVPFVIAGVLTYGQLSRFLESIAEEKAQQIAVDLSALAQNVFHRELNFVSSVARNAEIREAAASGKYRFIQKRLEDTFHISGAYEGSLLMVDKNGIVRADADDPKRIGTNLSHRSYFQTAKAGKANIGVPVTARTKGVMGKRGVALCAPIISETYGFVGAAVIFLEIKFIVDALNSVKLGETGHAYLADKRGSILVYPNKKSIHRTKDEEERLKPLADAMEAGNAGTARYTFGGVNRMAAFAPIPITGWNVVVTQNIDEIMAPVKKILNILIAGGIIFLGITVLSIIVLSKKISTPAQQAIETLKQMTLHSGELVAVMGKDRKIEFVNLAMEKLMKQSLDAVIGTLPDLTNVNDIPEEEIWHCLDTGNIWAGRLKVNEGAGQPALLETMIIPLRNKKDQIFSYLEICRDITHELMVESRLRQAQKIEAIGTLAGGIAHDFNNILGGIFGYTELALIQEDLPPKAKLYISEVLKAAGRAKDLVKQILTFSRQAELELTEITPKFIINEALKLLRATIPATIELSTGLNSTAVIIADPTQIHQLIVNLYTNAVYAMKDGKGVIDITLEDIDVDEAFARLHPGIQPGKHLHLKVKDTGCGIEPEIMDHIFDPFFTTKPKGEGTGLGLSLVHGIIKKLKGTITVISEVGKGTTFDIVIPVAPPNAETPQEDMAESFPNGNERIMLVDDEAQIAEAFSAMLNMLGYRVTIFTNSLQALEVLRNRTADFDLLITDHTMPNLTGIEIAEQVKEMKIKIPVILCSGYVNQELEESCHNAGIVVILRKPFGLPEIASSIRRALATS
jgi:signal transduction histidine kinase/ActR/RegA family two-component response regulator